MRLELKSVWGVERSYQTVLLIQTSGGFVDIDQKTSTRPYLSMQSYCLYKKALMFSVYDNILETQSVRLMVGDFIQN
jgi:hypothetical protein